MDLNVISKIYFWQNKIEYLGFGITQYGIRPLNKKIEAINNMTPPTTWKGVHKFIGLFNYYRYVWVSRSHTLKPLTNLMSNI